MASLDHLFFFGGGDLCEQVGISVPQHPVVTLSTLLASPFPFYSSKGRTEGDFLRSSAESVRSSLPPVASSVPEGVWQNRLI
jgi:hypothetical protein